MLTGLRMGRIAVLWMVAGCASSAFGQYQVKNDGRALEAKLNVQGRANYTRPDLMQEVRMRNAVVTGNAPNGRSLRINVGYSGQDDFRGVLASDSTYKFRRDSLASSAAVQGTDALQYQYALTTGNSYGTFARSEGGVPRSLSSGPESAASATGAAAIGRSQQARQDALSAAIPPSTGSGLGMMRSSGAYLANQSLSPVVVGSKPSEFGYEAMAASPLVGIRNAVVGKSRYEAVRSAFAATSAAMPAPNSTEVKSTSAATPEFKTAYDDLRARAATMYPPPPPEAEKPSTPGLPDTMPGQKPGPTGGTTPPAGAGTPGTTPNSPSGSDGDNRPEGGDSNAGLTPLDLAVKSVRERLMKTPAPKKLGSRPGEVDTSKDPNNLVAADPRDIELLEKLSSRSNTFSTGDVQPRDFFGQNMREGEKLMGEGNYFDAEERFSRALSYKPGEPAAQVARLHAQLGAGLYTSAALNVRSLLTSHPELIATHWTGPTVPTAARMKEVIKVLKGGLEDPPVRYAPPVETAALLLAYSGWQTENLAEVARGLDALQAKSPEDPLPGVLRSIWLAPRGK